MSQLPDAMDSFQPLPKVRSSERVAEVIRRTIIEGRFRPGERLPPERTLADRFQVTRNTVREAMRQLEQLRLVSIRQGSGVMVQDYLGTAGLEFLAVLLGDQRGLGIRDVLEARAVMGGAILGHAIDRVRTDRLGHFYACVDAFVTEARREAPDTRVLQELEFELHQSLIRAAGNRAFILLWNSIRHIYERVAPIFEMVVDDPDKLAARYERAAKALKRGDRAAARRAVQQVFRVETPAHDIHD